MRIVLCDDDKNELMALEQFVHSHLSQREELPFSILTYQNSKQLLFDLEDVAKADVYILDIDMPDVNGIDIAKCLMKLNPHVILFFYTSHAEFATSGYLTEAKRYILKSGSNEELKEALDYACYKYEESKKKCISLFIYHDIINLPLDEILYIERHERSLAITTQQNSILYYRSSIKDFLEHLNSPIFIMIDKSTIINIDYVYKTQDNIVTMFNQKRFVISRRRIGPVKEAIMKYWKEV